MYTWFLQLVKGYSLEGGCFCVFVTAGGVFLWFFPLRHGRSTSGAATRLWSVRVKREQRKVHGLFIEPCMEWCHFPKPVIIRVIVMLIFLWIFFSPLVFAMMMLKSVSFLSDSGDEQSPVAKCRPQCLFRLPCRCSVTFGIDIAFFTFWTGTILSWHHSWLTFADLLSWHHSSELTSFLADLCRPFELTSFKWVDIIPGWPLQMFFHLYIILNWHLSWLTFARCSADSEPSSPKPATVQTSFSSCGMDELSIIECRIFSEQRFASWSCWCIVDALLIWLGLLRSLESISVPRLPGPGSGKGLLWWRSTGSCPSKSGFL